MEYCTITDISLPEYCRPDEARQVASNRDEMLRILGSYAWWPPRIVVARSARGTQLHIGLGYYPTRASGEHGAVTAFLSGDMKRGCPIGWTVRANVDTACSEAYYRCEDDWFTFSRENMIPYHELTNILIFAIEHDYLPTSHSWYSADGTRLDGSSQAANGLNDVNDEENLKRTAGELSREFPQTD